MCKGCGWPVATIGRSPIAPTETAVERWLDIVETEGLLLKQKSTIKKGVPKQSPSLATLDSVSATASVGAVALQRCPPDTRTLYTRGSHYALINSHLQIGICFCSPLIIISAKLLLIHNFLNLGQTEKNYRRYRSKNKLREHIHTVVSK